MFQVLTFKCKVSGVKFQVRRFRHEMISLIDYINI